ncbi:metal-dependent amidase/aminoacylase/carboxypeptidase [Lojkania enalia]|uniref:Metal-dependent amidase/aminoacylase/carboxypeptidase n=1 Tax=Lojkania enalia TaxID=147567 RepID=A0A9P4N761_9PLEO|nr:metal-dependent amidase/aminoacylase/carboxypeptidase [Didymosphaeria enalia]
METQPGSLHSIVEKYLPVLGPFEDRYRDIHQHPELGRLEKRTSEIAAYHLRQFGYNTLTNIGGYGVVGILENGVGPTVLLRADMDALPIREQTGLHYASTVEAIDTDGERKPVMHACGHDMHTTSLMGASTLLANAKGKWKGTLICLFQPDEEHGTGAQAMINDDLYGKIPKPNIVLGQHLTNSKTGVVLIRPGSCMASADTFKVTVFGRGAHAAQPQDSIDPILLAASIIVRLQSVVAREIGPEDVASVSCATIHGGKAHNVIPYEVELTLNIRTFDPAVREKVIEAVKRIIKGEAITSGAEKEPKIELLGSFPPTINSTPESLKLRQSFISFFGEERTWEAGRHTASEDFTNLATAIGVPSIFWNFGGVDEEKWKKFEAEKDPKIISGSHQEDYAPVVQPTLRTAIEALSVAALTFLKVD